MFSVFAALTAVATFLLATAAIVAVSAKTDSTVTASAPVAVSLTEFKITPCHHQRLGPRAARRDQRRDHDPQPVGPRPGQEDQGPHPRREPDARPGHPQGRHLQGAVRDPGPREQRDGGVTRGGRRRLRLGHHVERHGHGGRHERRRSQRPRQAGRRVPGHDRLVQALPGHDPGQGQRAARADRRSRRHQGVQPRRRHHRLGGRARQDGQGLDLQRHRARSPAQGQRGRPRQGRGEERPPRRLHRRPPPRRRRPLPDGRRLPHHPGPDQAGRELHLRLHPRQDPHGHVPRPPHG